MRFARHSKSVILCLGSLMLAASFMGCSESDPASGPAPSDGGPRDAHPTPAPDSGAPDSASLACEVDGATSGRGAPIAKYDASACSKVPTSNATTCPVEKIDFPQCRACMNDGYVELCLSKDDEATKCAISVIAPGTLFVDDSGSGGRIGCTAAQTLVMVPMQRDRDCVAAYGATDEAWSRLCAVAALENVKKIVPTVLD